MRRPFRRVTVSTVVLGADGNGGECGVVAVAEVVVVVIVVVVVKNDDMTGAVRMCRIGRSGYMKRTSLWDTRLRTPMVVNKIVENRNRMSVFIEAW